MMNMYIIGTISPLNDIDFIKDTVTFELPKDYFDFLKEYGYGNICEVIYFYEPDEQHIKNTFMEYIDELWDWQNEKQKNMVLNGLSIGGTIDGDIICCVNDNLFPYVFLPRHLESILSFENIELLFSYCFSYYGFKELYFDPEFKSVIKMISLIKNSSLDKLLINNIQKLFLEKYKTDKVFDKDSQPKYIIQDIGGWVYMDLVYKNSIRVKYQSMHEAKANEIISFIEEKI